MRKENLILTNSQECLSNYVIEKKYMIESSINNVSKLEGWILASRPKTLLASFVPVIVGSSIAYNDGQFHPISAFVALVCAVLLQVGTNLVNDLYDFLAGTDSKNRLGPQRAVVSGLISPSEMKIGIITVFVTAFLLGLYLVLQGGWLILLIGTISILASIAYTAGPYPLAYNGLGDIFVFLFFGFVGTVGSYFVQTQTVSLLAFWASIPVGALITNILVVNNYRDYNEDRIAGKNTLAVKFGQRFTRYQYIAFMIISYLILFVVYFSFKPELIIFLPLLSLPISVKLVRMIYKLEGKELNKTLELTAKLSAIYGLLFAIGILV